MKKVKYRADFLVQWNKRLSHDITEPLVDKVVEAVLYSQQIPFEHSNEYRNIYAYEKLWDQLEHYEPEITQDERNVHIEAGLSRAFKLFARPKTESYLDPVNITTGATSLFAELNLREHTAAGLTAYGQTKLQAFAVGLDKSVGVLKKGKSPSPCLAGVRTQRKGKTRLVWGYPMEMTIIEAIVARPLNKRFLNSNKVMSYGVASHEIGMKLRRSSANNKFFLSIDYSQFDATVPREFISHAFGALRSWFDPSATVYQDVTVKQVFDIVENYFIHTPIVMPNREREYPTLVLGKDRGVPSGSYFTQIVDSFANAALIFAISSRFQLAIKDDDVNILGDDCLVFLNQLVDLNKLDSFVSRFGFRCNTQKSAVGRSNQCIDYLGRTWRNGFPLRKYSELVRGGLYPERYRKYSELQGVREHEALNILNSYLLTSYIEDAPVGVERFKTSLAVHGRHLTGLSKYLILEGFIPGKQVKRAVY